MSKQGTGISRVTRSKEQARRNYDRLSRWYDRLAMRSERRCTELGLEKLAVHEGDRVLEIGFGTGEGLLALARSVGAAGEAHGIDLSEGMLRVAGRKVAAAGLEDRVHLQRSDATHIQYPDESFDRVFMGFVLELFDTPEIPLVLVECRRVLRAHGKICIVGMSKKGGWAEQLYEWFHRRFPALVDCRPIFVRRALDSAGFQILDSTMLSMWGLGVEIVLAHKSTS